MKKGSMRNVCTGKGVQEIPLSSPKVFSPGYIYLCLKVIQIEFYSYNHNKNTNSVCIYIYMYVPMLLSMCKRLLMSNHHNNVQREVLS